MGQRERVTLSLPGDVVEIIEANSTPRTKADFVAKCIRAYVENMGRDDVGILERIEAKLDRLSRLIAEGRLGN